MYNKFKLKRIKDIAPLKLISSSFALIILTGSILLMAPISSKVSNSTTFIDSLFVSTSATCVTGLTPVDTYSHWTVFGQFVILLLIQLGGLGIISFTCGVTLLMRRKLDLRDLMIAREYTSGDTIDITRLIKTILFVTLLCEFLGTLVLMIRFVPQFGLKGAWISVFFAVSAYCNAGFDILGFIQPSTSLEAYVNDPLVCLTISFLIIIGGIGFIVIADVYALISNKYTHKIFKPHLELHSIVVLSVTATLLIVGTALVFIFEYDNTLAYMNFFEKLHASFFQSVTLRTAGFFSIDQGNLHTITKIVSIILMFIGASPSSTGGGIKTTTFAILFFTIKSVLSGKEDTTIKNHLIEKNLVYRSFTTTALAILVVVSSTTVLCLSQSSDTSFINMLFEVVSAMGTVGISAGITPYLTVISKIALIITMFIGRVGPVSLILSLTLRHNKRSSAILPKGKIVVG